MTGVFSKHAGRGIGKVVLLFLFVLTGRPQTAISRSTATDFDARAGQIGRSEAWFELNGPAYPPAPGTDLPQLLMPALAVSDTLTHTVALPLVLRAEAVPMVERRAIWVTRYDWTTLSAAPAPATIDTIVANVASAGFNSIFFQVRGAGDAYYTPGLEPWADRLTTGPVSETLGVDPGWDPLARMIAQAHAVGVEVHAYVNVYTAWLSPANSNYGQLWPPATIPAQMFDTFTYGPSYPAHPGVYGFTYDWRQHDESLDRMPLEWASYLWASPGVDEVHTYVAAVVNDIVQRYAVDGVHLDLVRYPGPGYSYDPFSNAMAGTTKTPARDQWQRDRVTALVLQVRDETHALRPAALVSAAVWPCYVDAWGWGLGEGYSDYYQDSKGWLISGAVDAIAPMLYGGSGDDLARWQVLMEDFAATPAAGDVYPGIGGYYEDFAAISTRIGATRAAGLSGHVVFSYSGVDGKAYWDDLANGPYKIPAVLP